MGKKKAMKVLDPADAFGGYKNPQRWARNLDPLVTRGLIKKQEKAKKAKERAGQKTAEELYLEERQQKELSEQRKRTNVQLKAALRGRIGARSLLSGGYSGIGDELTAAAALGGTRPGRTAAGAGIGAIGGGGGGRASAGGGYAGGARGLRGGTLIP